MSVKLSQRCFASTFV